MKEEPKISNVVAGYRPAIGGEDNQFQTSAKPYLIQTAVSILITILNVLSVDSYAYMLKCLTKNLFYNMKLLLQHREENINAFLLGRTNHN